MNKYEIWDSWGDIHNDVDQKKRIASAKKANMTPVHIDEENLSGEFTGSAKYHVTLLNCNCSDFRRRNLPCKHIYRLAIELGVLNETAVSDATKIRSVKTDRFTITKLVKKVEALTDPQRELLRDYMLEVMFRNKSGFVFADITPDSEAVISTEIFVKKESDFTPEEVEKLFKKITKPELYNILTEMGYSGLRSSLSKASLVDFAKENVTDLSTLFPNTAIITLNSKMEGVQRKLYSYLLRRDCDESYFLPNGKIIDVPHGALVSLSDENELTVEFPDDELTWILNSLGLNRCDDWKA